jgi:intein/homing endonuclease
LIYTLNPSTLKPIFQKPTAKQEYDYQGEMYKITLEDGTILYVSPEHKVYVKN